MKLPSRRRIAERYLDRYILNLIAQKARDWCPDEESAFSAFLSEIASVPWLRKYVP